MIESKIRSKISKYFPEFTEDVMLHSVFGPRDKRIVNTKDETEFVLGLCIGFDGDFEKCLSGKYWQSKVFAKDGFEATCKFAKIIDDNFKDVDKAYSMMGDMFDNNEDYKQKLNRMIILKKII